jgi:hypothetical protein
MADCICASLNVSPCTGAADCPEQTHIHGCFADIGNCDEPEQHTEPPAPSGATRVHEGPFDPVVEFVALTLAQYGDSVNTRLADVIPQAVWDDLTERGLIHHGCDHTGEGYCVATNAGADYLIERVAARAR